MIADSSMCIEYVQIILSSRLTYVSVSHHTFGPVSQMLPHVCHQLVDPFHWKGDVILVGEAIMSQCLSDTFTQWPQSLRKREQKMFLSFGIIFTYAIT